MTGHVDPERAAFKAFAALPQDAPIAMLNLVRYREIAAYPEGTEPCTGKQAYRRYARAAAAPFERAGGRILWGGTPELLLIGPAEERWDTAFIAAYPSAAAFLAMLADPEYREAVRHRTAAVADSRLIRCTPDGGAFGPARA